MEDLKISKDGIELLLFENMIVNLKKYNIINGKLLKAYG